MEPLYGEATQSAEDHPKLSKVSKKAPQEVLADFWDKFHSKHPGKVTSIFPRSLYKNVLPLVDPRGAKSSQNAADSYEAAAKACREKVQRIARECRRTNEKFIDPDFDIEHDPDSNCLNGLIRDTPSGPGNPEATPVTLWEMQCTLDTIARSNVLGEGGTIPVDVAEFAKAIGNENADTSQEAYSPGSIHRLDWIFESPQFTVDGYSSSDIKQGANGDCWWLAAVATIAHRKDLMDKVCVARDEEAGVYGFVFQRDGEWTSTVVDDNLYLRAADFAFTGDVYDSTGKKARLHRVREQTGSEALYFARCEDPNETWLPLLEKAYSKAHGDYQAVSGGWPGEAVEDMTGGVTTTVATNRVMSKDKLWNELVNADGEFVFALAAMGTGWDTQKSGLALGHAYSILQSREEVDENGKKFRLVQVRNPWGERSERGLGEWNGPWSDGSKEWTPYWLKKMNHTFGDDGVFWISYQDMLNTFMYIERTRLFDHNWTVVQQWTSANVSWVTGYLQTKFQIEVKKSGLVVIVLTQLDGRYFRGFEGNYYFDLHFLLQEVNAPVGEHICRVRPVHPWETRSVSCEVELEAGTYEVLPRINATRKPDGSAVEDIVKEYAEKNPQKLRQIGMQFDQAHAKGGVVDEDEVLEKKKAEENRKKEEKKQKALRKKALAKAAKAVDKAADAMKEAVKADAKGENTPEDKSDDEEDGDDDDETEPGSDADGDDDDDDDNDEAEKKKDEDDSDSESESESEEEEEEEEDADEEEERDSPAWNAVCVLGLRVYAQDHDVAITLTKAEAGEESSALTLDGVPAGATM